MEFCWSLRAYIQQIPFPDVQTLKSHFKIDFILKSFSLLVSSISINSCYTELLHWVARERIFTRCICEMLWILLVLSFCSVSCFQQVVIYFFYLILTIFTAGVKHHGCIKLGFTTQNYSIDRPINFHLKSDSHLPKKCCFICFIERPLKLMKNIWS